ncbi:hypothetical protein JOQ06_029796, partial [Pogonophryne albipinna]
MPERSGAVLLMLMVAEIRRGSGGKGGPYRLDAGHKVHQYDIVGHSGDGYDIELVRADKVPKNNKERLKVLKRKRGYVLSSGLSEKLLTTWVESRASNTFRRKMTCSATTHDSVSSV